MWVWVGCAHAVGDPARVPGGQVDLVDLEERIPRFALALEDELVAVGRKIALAGPAPLERHAAHAAEEVRFRPLGDVARAGGVPFSVAVVGRERRGRRSRLRARRWADGLPAEVEAGSVGRLFVRAEG